MDHDYNERPGFVPSDKVHVISGSMEWFQYRPALYQFARWVTGRDQFEVAEAIAADFDFHCGSDDGAVGSAMMLIIRSFPHEEDHIHRVLLVADMLRKSRRTKH